MKLKKKRRNIGESKEKVNLAKYLTIEELKSKYSIKYLCSVLELNRSSYYNYLKVKDIKRDLELIEAIKEIDKEVKSTYGRNRMIIAVNNKLNTKYNSKKIRRIMIENDITCVIRIKKRKYVKTKAEYIAENILKRDFTTTSDNQKYSTDITEIKTNEGKLYLSGVIDMHSKKIIAYEIGESNNNQLVFDTFKTIMNQKNVNFNNITLQSDRGYQYTSYQFKEIIKGITHSMNKPGSCPDNSPIESFWGVFKAESYYNPLCKDDFKTKESAIKTINEYIEFYNNKRINLKGTTPNKIRNNSLNLTD